MLKPLQAGELRHRIVIQAATQTRDGYGDETPTWATAATVWGKVEPMGGRELAYAQQTYADSTHKVTIRYYTGLTTRHRLIHRGRTFNILSGNDSDERRVYQELICKEVV